MVFLKVIVSSLKVPLPLSEDTRLLEAISPLSKSRDDVK